jgi:peptidoglycan-associated lipoprotein
MSKRSAILPVAIILALGLSACATKKKRLPAAPPAAVVNTVPEKPFDPNAATAVKTTWIPGSEADFVGQSGSDTVLFPYDSYDVDDDARTILSKQAQWLTRYPSVRITVEGHADERGTREYNLALGDRRATAAKNFLAAQGVATDRMTTISYGKERPAVEGSDEEAFARNRRAVTVVAVTQ